MLLCRNFPFCGLSGVDEVEDEDSHNKGAEGVEQYIAEAHRGARAPRRRRAEGLLRPLWQSVDSRPPKHAERGSGPLTDVFDGFVTLLCPRV